MKRYSEYKASDAKWAGNIPESWECLRFKDLSVVNRGASPRPIDDPKYFDDNGDYSWVRIADLSASERYLLTTKQKLSQLGASLSVKRYPGDFFLSIAGTVGKPIITKIKCCIHDGFVWFPNLKINSEFLYYLCSTGTPYQGLGKLGTQLNLNTETVGNIFIPIPSKNEIDGIVSYLDTETGKIDAKVADLEKKARLYKELKQSLINETVTRGLPPTEAQKAGLTPNPTMKDSGIPWIGEIPAHWEVKRMKDLFKERSVKGFPKEPILVASQDKGVVIKSSYEKNSMTAQKNFEGLKLVNINDFVISLRSFEGGIEIAHDRGIISSAYTVLRSEKQCPLYFRYTLKSEDFILLLRKCTTGIREGRNVNYNELKREFMATPSQKEQQAIASYLDLKTTLIDKILLSIEQQILTLKELRKTLINDVVTGKICVTDTH